MLGNIVMTYSPWWLIVPLALVIASSILWLRTRSVAAGLQVVGSLAFLVWAAHDSIFIFAAESSADIQTSREVSFWTAVVVFPVGFLWHALRVTRRI
jgi:hypothetical protein